jgi:hypothetical protein
VLFFGFDPSGWALRASATENLVDSQPELAIVDEPCDNHEQLALSLRYAIVCVAGFPLDSSNFIFILAFQGGITHRFPISSLVLRFTSRDLHLTVTLALDFMLVSAVEIALKGT